MKTVIAILLISFFAISCQENEPVKEVKITNFKGITSRDFQGNQIGIQDLTDWYLTDTWTQDEINLFSYLNPNQVCTTVLLDSVIAYPNPAQKFIYFRIDNPDHVKFSYRLVDRHFNILFTGDSLDVPGTTHLMLNVENFQNLKGDTVRLYYAFYEDIIGCTLPYHGDIAIQP